MGMASVALGAQAFGTGMSMIGSYNAAEAQKQTLNYEASVAHNNAAIAEYQAGLALQIGQQNEEAQRLKAANMMGDQRAALAANGVDLGSGSPSEILATTKFMGERDALTIRDNAARQAWAYKNTAAGSRAEENADLSAGNAISPFAAGAGSLLTGAGAVATNWYKYNRATNGATTDGWLKG